MTTQYSIPEALDVRVDRAVGEEGFVSKSELVRYATRDWLERNAYFAENETSDPKECPQCGGSYTRETDVDKYDDSIEVVRECTQCDAQYRIEYGVPVILKTWHTSDELPTLTGGEPDDTEE